LGDAEKQCGTGSPKPIRELNSLGKTPPTAIGGPSAMRTDTLRTLGDPAVLSCLGSDHDFRNARTFRLFRWSEIDEIPNLPDRVVAVGLKDYGLISIEQHATLDKATA
jgi:hypothetical protein